MNTLKCRQRMHGKICALRPLTRRTEIDLWHFITRNSSGISQLEVDIETAVRSRFHIQA